MKFDKNLANSDDKKRTQFRPDEFSITIIGRSAKQKSWTNGEWELISNNGYQLKKAGKLLYEGDGEIGNKVSGSDDSEDVAPTE